MNIVDFPTAKRLKELGMKQGKSHLKWWWYDGSTWETAQVPVLSCHIRENAPSEALDPLGHSEAMSCDAPDVLEALEWLETISDISFHRNNDGWMIEDETGHLLQNEGYRIVWDNPHALLVAALEHMKEE